jgi:hypothetical protein
MLNGWKVAPEGGAGRDEYAVTGPEGIDVVNHITGAPINESIGYVPESDFSIQHSDQWAQAFLTSPEYSKAQGELFSGMSRRTFTEGIERKKKRIRNPVIDLTARDMPQIEPVPSGQCIIGSVTYNKFLSNHGSEIIFIPEVKGNFEIPSFSIFDQGSETDSEGGSLSNFRISVYKEHTLRTGVTAGCSFLYDSTGKPVKKVRKITIPNSWVDFKDSRFNQCLRINIEYSEPVSQSNSYQKIPELKVINDMGYGGYVGELTSYSVAGETDDAIQMRKDYDFLSHIFRDYEKPEIAVQRTADNLAFSVGQILSGKPLQAVTAPKHYYAGKA